MYKALIRPILFQLDPEKVHHLIVVLVKAITYIPGLNKILRSWLTYNHPILKTKIAGLEFNNKVGMAAGFDKNADFFNEFSIFGFSSFEIGTVTPLPQTGNIKPRLFRLVKDRALINRMGFNNKGADYAVRQLKKRDGSIIVGGNIGKNTLTPNDQAADDYEKCFTLLYESVDYFAVNVSCPNIQGLERLQDQDSLREILERIMKVRAGKSFRKPVFLKISPDLSKAHLDEIIELYHEVGLDGIIATNTSTKRINLKTSDELIKSIGSGGLSGYPLQIATLETIRYICKQSGNRIPIIGVGGILNTRDAIEMIKAGASLVQVYTGFIYDGPCIVKRINKALAKYLSSQPM